MKKIGTKLVVFVSIIMSVLSATILAISYGSFNKMTNDILTDQCASVLNIYHNTLQSTYNSVDQLAKTFSSSKDIKNGFLEKDDYQLSYAYKNSYESEFGFAIFVGTNGGIIWKSENAPQEFDLSTALAGEQSSDIFGSENTVLSYQSKTPILDNSKVIGAVLIGHFLNDTQIVDHIKELTGSEITLFQNDIRINTTVLKPDGTRGVGTQLVANIANQVLNEGKVFTGDALVLGVKMKTIYEPLRNKDNTILGITFVGYPTEKIISSLNKSTIFNIAVSLAILFASLAVLIVFLKRIVSEPIKKIKNIAVELENGNLQCDLLENSSKDELGVLSRTMNRTVEQLNRYIQDISSILGFVASGDFTQSSKIDYNGDFIKIKNSINKITTTLATVMRGLNSTSDNVYSSAEQISNGAQLLASGATEQASSVQELSATIYGVSEEVTKNADNVNSAKDYVDQTVGDIGKSNQEMQKMLLAMNAISRSSNQISTINKVIEDIAFQTNILALNAAVEAARAGSAGKGFAVVAEEVRSLASKSAEASQQATALIEESIKAVSEGSIMAEHSATALDAVVEKSLHIKEIIEKIDEASSAQADAIAQINQGIEQISAVVQTNSATAEQSAAASEELTLQALSLKQEVERFKIK